MSDQHSLSSNQSDFDADLERLEQVEIMHEALRPELIKPDTFRGALENIHDDRGFLLAFIDKLWREYTTVLGRLDARPAHEPLSAQLARRCLQYVKHHYQGREPDSEDREVTKQLEAIIAGASEPPSASQLEKVLQQVMARLADMLDDDKFNNIEAIVREAGVRYPDECPPGACHASVRHDGSFGMVICGVCKMPIPAETKAVVLGIDMAEPGSDRSALWCSMCGADRTLQPCLGNDPTKCPIGGVAHETGESHGEG